MSSRYVFLLITIHSAMIKAFWWRIWIGSSTKRFSGFALFVQMIIFCLVPYVGPQVSQAQNILSELCISNGQEWISHSCKYKLSSINRLLWGSIDRKQQIFTAIIYLTSATFTVEENNLTIHFLASVDFTSCIFRKCKHQASSVPLSHLL